MEKFGFSYKTLIGRLTNINYNSHLHINNQSGNTAPGALRYMWKQYTMRMVSHYNNLPLRYTPVWVRIPIKCAILLTKTRVHILLFEHVM